jgi:hypothetical protein
VVVRLGAAFFAVDFLTVLRLAPPSMTGVITGATGGATATVGCIFGYTIPL